MTSNCSVPHSICLSSTAREARIERPEQLEGESRPKADSRRRRRRVKLSTLYTQLTEEEISCGGVDERKGTCLPSNRVRVYIPVGGGQGGYGQSFYVATLDERVTGKELIQFLSDHLKLHESRRAGLRLEMQLTRQQERQALY